MIRLDITQHRTPGQFIAWLDYEPLVVSRQPLVDGARVLMERGFDPDLLLTMRHVGLRYDSFRPLPLSLWAEITYREPDRGYLSSTRWNRLHEPTAPQETPIDENNQQNQAI